ncbi:hypothetical protein OS493_031750 [Desmophyllum pertusum]|uniref:Uncharacterized protein n=1 Tax=Desmophyllum pertusum TaxID=174260 RepID=A0A9X0CUU8_9CNID|nr:hypothetical protein OS493_031750 [Desmophyllum pertusum]
MKDGIPDRQKAETRREQFSVPQSSDGKKDKIRGNQNSSEIHGKAKWRERLMTPVWIRNRRRQKERKGNSNVSIFLTCDETYKLDIVEKLLDANQRESDELRHIDRHEEIFRLFEMSELCTTIRSGPPMDFAILSSMRTNLALN